MWLLHWRMEDAQQADYRLARWRSWRGHSFFFFSSRRRHTRCSRDWSSDVCSSDLPDSSVPLRRPSPLFVHAASAFPDRSEEHTSELQSRLHLVCRLLLEKKKTTTS